MMPFGRIGKGSPRAIAVPATINVNVKQQLFKLYALTAALLLTLSATAQGNLQGVSAHEVNPLDSTYTSLSFSPAAQLSPAQAQLLFSRYLGMNEQSKMVLTNSTTTKHGATVDRYTQYYKGVKVELSNCVVSSINNRISFLTANYYKLNTDMSVTPALTAEAALAKALRRVAAQKYMWQDSAMEQKLRKLTGKADTSHFPKGELVWIEDMEGDAHDRKLHLAYACNIYAMQPLSRDMVYVDANTGAILLVNPLIHHVGATGASLYSGTVGIQAKLLGSSYVLQDVTRGGGVNTYDCLNGDGSAAVNVSSATTSFGTNAAVDAHWGAGRVYDYWKNEQGRNSYNNAGAAINSFVHYMVGYNNAFWDGYEMVYGDGSGVASGGFSPLTSLDVCAHEIGHAICQHTAGLVYTKESGAMNEGFSDIWGAVVEAYANPHEVDAVAKSTWGMGEEIGSSPMRRMDNPNLRGQPDTYGGSYWYAVAGCTPSSSNDYCGVHRNSGVLNYWFYLLCQGGTGTNDLGNAFSVSSIGMDKAADIAYQTELALTSTATFANCRTASINAATMMYGACSPEVQAVTRAWYAVGVGANYVGTVTSITGAGTLCSGATTALASSATGGTWSSSNSAVATVSAGGLVTGISAGTAIISYATSGGCYGTKVISVSATPAAIGGTATVCTGATTVLTNAVVGGTWSVSNPAVATVTATGTVTGISAGTATITYLTGSSCYSTKVVTVSAAPAAIGGIAAICAGSTTALTNAVLGGTWNSSNAAVATVSATGTVTGISAGTATITYTTGSSCYSTKVVTVSATPAAIGGAASVCAGASTVLTNTVAGGTWSSSNAAVATVSASGTLTGVSAGAATITYTTGSSCYSTKVVTVSAAPTAIVGAASVCAGANTVLTNIVAGGTWSSSNAAVATVSATGTVTGISAGTATITYSTGSSCYSTKVVTVSATPAAIGGAASVCAGVSTVLTNAVAGGTWSSSNTSIATVSVSGTLTGVSAGTATITYTAGSSCYSTKVVTVSAAPAAIGGAASVCAGASTALTNTVAGGTWSSSNAAVASINSGGVITGLAAGTATITYTSAGGCIATKTVTVNALPVPGTLSGATSMVAGTAASLSSTVSGGVWTTSDPSIASVTSSGVVNAVSAGSVTITYAVSNGCGSAYTTRSIAVTSSNAAPVFTGGAAQSLVVCESSAATSVNTLLAVSDANVGQTETWTVSSAPAHGILGGFSTSTLATGGVVLPSGLTYAPVAGYSGSDAFTVKVSDGAATATITINVTVNAMPVISGGGTLCTGSATMLSSSVVGGTWTSSNVAVANVAGGLVTGIGAGTAVITHTSGSGCTATRAVTVNSAPSAPVIIGASTVAVGGTISLSSSATGGTWTSSNPARAAVSGGVITGVSAGTAAITYTVANSCGSALAVRVVTVSAVVTNSAPVFAAPSGALTLCQGAGATSISGHLATSDADAGQMLTWTLSATPAHGTVSGLSAATLATGGSVAPSGVSYTPAAGYAGTDAFTITVSDGVVSATRTINVTINPTPVIGGASTVCVGVYTLLTASAGGTWSSSAPAIANMGTSPGMLTGVAAGTSVITYTSSAGCRAQKVVTVIAMPAAGSISGVATVSLGSSIMLSATVTGGMWSSANTAIATVNSAGLVTGMAAGVVSVSYTVTGACGSTHAVKVVTVQAATGVDDQVQQVTALSIYPNPTAGPLTVTSDVDGILYLFSMDGKQVAQYKVLRGTTNVELPGGLAPGVYPGRFVSDDGTHKEVIRIMHRR